MQRRSIDPWGWEGYAVTPATEVISPSRTLYCSGLPAQVGEDDVPPSDMRGQMAAALDNVEALLAAAGMGLANVVRLNLYTTDIDATMAAYEVLAERLTRSDAKVTGCLLGVARLARADLMVEIEATAVD